MARNSNRDSLSAARENVPLLTPPIRIQDEELDDQPWSDTDDNAALHSRYLLSTRTPFLASSSSPQVYNPHSPGTSNSPNLLYPHDSEYSHSNINISPCSTASATPNPSRSSSPAPLYFQSSTSDSGEESEPDSPLLLGASLRRRREGPRWWQVASASTARRRRRRDAASWFRTAKRMVRNFIRLPFVPKTPLTIILTLVLLTVFGLSLTFLLIYILNPDKEPLPWRGYCTIPRMTTGSPPSVIPPTVSFPFVPPQDFTPPSFPPDNFDTLSPAGVFVGVFSMDAAVERRMHIRTTFASHPRSRNGAGEGDGGEGTSRTIVRFILGQPRKDWERRIQLEMETHKDMIILPMSENMNDGKSHAYFTWATQHAWVPPLYSDSWDSIPTWLSYTNITTPPPALAAHDPIYAQRDQAIGVRQPWVRPDFVVKADDDSFLMLAELEARLRVELHDRSERRYAMYTDSKSNWIVRRDGNQDEVIATDVINGTTSITPVVLDPEHTSDSHSQPLSEASSSSSSVRPTFTLKLPEPRPGDPEVNNDPLIYWGYLVKNRFMAGELYALSWSLTTWVANDSNVKTMTRGAEDKQTSKWMRVHPRSHDIRWASERCWIYDHPRAGNVYSHGFLFPSEVKRVQRDVLFDLKQFWTREEERSTVPEPDAPPSGVVSVSPFGAYGVSPAWWARSTVSTFGSRYSLPIPASELTTAQSVEALVEGSEMSKLIKVPGAIDPSWQYREGRRKRYGGKRLGGTIVVHYIKKNMWFLETALAFLEGDEMTEAERSHAEQDALALGRNRYHGNESPAFVSTPGKVAVALNTNANIMRERRIAMGDGDRSWPLSEVQKGHPPQH